MQNPKTSLNRVLLLLLCAHMSTIFSAAADPASNAVHRSARRHLTVRQAVEQAQKHDPRLQQLQDRLLLLRGQTPPRLKARFPRLFIEYSGSESYSWDTAYRALHTLGGGLELGLTDSGASWYRAQELKRDIQRSELQIREQRQSLTLEVVQLCMRIFFHRSLAALLNEDLQFYRRLCRSTEQRRLAGTVSGQEHRRILLETREKELVLQAERIELQDLHSQLKLLLREERPIELRGTLPDSEADYRGILAAPDRAVCRARAEQFSIEVTASQLDYRQASDFHSLQLRRYVPAVKVYSRIDFSGPEFPPATPAVSFGLSISSGAGRLAITAEDSVERSIISYGRSPAARAEFDLSGEAASPRRHTAEARQYARRKLRYTIRLASEQAARLCSERAQLVELRHNQADRSELKQQSFEIYRRKFRYGSADFEQLVESREEYTDSLRRLLQLEQACYLTACRLLQHCALSEQLTQLLARFNAECEDTG